MSLVIVISLLFMCNQSYAQAKQTESELDKRVNDFLKKQSSM